MKNRHRFDKQGLLAIEPSAFFELFFEAEDECAPFEMVGECAIVDIDGPLDHHAGWWCDSYDAISERMSAAIASNAKTVIMRINSPGGVVSGCFSMVRSIRAKAELAGKPIVAHVDGLACSAGYAIASIADKVVCSDTAILGSIGVIQTRVDVTKMDAAHGVQIEFITSGSRKADGHPQQAFSEEERKELQAVVDAMANVFFDWTAERRGTDFRPLQAGIAVGADAKAKKLADEVMSFDSLLAGLASGGIDMSKYTDARAALEDAAGEDGDEADKATKVLAYMDSLESGGDDEEETEPEEESSEDESEAESDEDEPAAEGGNTAAQMAATIQRLESELAATKKTSASSERDAFLATRPDLAASLVKLLKTKPLAEVKSIVNGIPKPRQPKAAASAAPKDRVVNPKPTPAAGRPGTAGVPEYQQNAADADALRQRMGLGGVTKMGVKNEPFKLVLGAEVPATGEGK